MRDQIFLDIIHSLRLKDWTKIILSLVIFIIANKVAHKWLLREKEKIKQKSNPYIERKNPNINSNKHKLTIQYENKSKRLEELSNKQKINSKIAKQQRREICEIKSRLKEVKQEIYEKRICERDH
ncbi:hypothetical protein FG386_001120 [Cryptosporidium ryanae]|uniref:uncharacterized protein n=1 Tax=Cryptosporidium ryanae TaxID=515981 RepID=UPI00351A4C21|nr:hypothetical protein FG386_001120 [Cryptosporidium ryanae]